MKQGSSGTRDESEGNRIMEKHVKESIQNYAKGYTCSQAVLCTYADEMGIEKHTAYKISEGFGGGCGGMQEICGALTAAFAIISFHNSDGKLAGGNSTRNTYLKIKEASALFEKEFGDIICRNILEGIKSCGRHCGKKVRVATEIVNQILDD